MNLQNWMCPLSSPTSWPSGMAIALQPICIQKSSLNNTTIDRMKPKVNIYGHNTNSKWFDLWLSFRPAKQCSTVRFDCWAIRVFFSHETLHLRKRIHHFGADDTDFSTCTLFGWCAYTELSLVLGTGRYHLVSHHQHTVLWTSWLL